MPFGRGVGEEHGPGRAAGAPRRPEVRYAVAPRVRSATAYRTVDQAVSQLSVPASAPSISARWASLSRLASGLRTLRS